MNVNTEENILARLKVGMRIRLPNSGEFIVTLVNESRAHITPVTKQRKQINKLNGDSVEFESIGRGLDISPNSECEILQ